MKKSLPLVVALFLFLFSNSQNLSQQWASTYAGTGENSDKFNALVRDASGNIYACGYTWRSGNGKDFLLVKFNSTGDTLWSRVYDGTGNGNDELNGLVFDNSGNIVVTGTSKTFTGKDITTAKYNSSGDSLWLVSYNYSANLDDYGIKVVSDNTGNVYVGGYGYNSNLNDDYIVLKYSSTGSQLGVITFDGSANLDDVLADMAIDGSNNIVVTGKSRTNGNKDDYATVKYNSSLAQQWVTTYDQANKTDRATGVWLDASANVYVTGRSNNGNFDNMVTIKYNTSGTQQWLQPFNIVNTDDRAVAITGNANMVVITGTVYNGVQYDVRTVAYPLTGGNPSWSTGYANANGKDDVPNHITLDGSGNVIVTGTTNISASANSNNDILLLQYNNTGVQQWVEITGGTANTDDNGSMSVTDGSGNIYTTGALANTTTMKDACIIKTNITGALQWNKAYNGDGEFSDKGILMTMSGGFLYSTGYSYAYGEDRNVCTIKYDASGNKLWVKTYNGEGSGVDEPRAIAPAGSGNIFVAGRTKNIAGNYDMLVIKYNPNGDTIWTRTYDGGVAGDDEVNAIAADAAGNLYVTGVTDNDPSIAVRDDFLTIKYNSAGNAIWTKQYNGTANGDDKAYSVAIDNSGNALVTGKIWNGTNYDIQTNKYASANGTETSFATYASNLGDDVAVKIMVDKNSNVCIGGKSDRDASVVTNIDFITLSYDSLGTQQWAQLYNGTGNGDDDLNSMTIDSAGNIYVVGSVDADATPLINSDYATVKYNSAGTKLWDKTFNGAANALDFAYDVAVDANGIVYVSGQSNQGTALVKNNDCVTMVYSSTGTELQHVTFDGPANATDAGSAVLFDNSSLYVTGYTTNTSVQQKDFLTIKYNLVSSVGEVKEKMSMQLYPNPVASTSSIHFSSEVDFMKMKIMLLDITGKKIAEDYIHNKSFDLNPYQLTHGIYFIRVFDESHLFDGKILVE